MGLDYASLLRSRASRRVLREKAEGVALAEEALRLRDRLLTVGYALDEPPLDDEVALQSYVKGLRREECKRFK